MYAPTRQHYERIEPIAELFSIWMAALTPVKMITSKKPPIRIHRFPPSGKSIVWRQHHQRLDQYADQLYTDVVDLQKRISNWLSHLQKWSAVQPD